ncbi:MAG: thioredoxin [Bradymonadia bacterium]
MSAPINIDLTNFKSEVLESEVPVVVDFWAPWCGPCRNIAPVLDELAQSYDGQVKVAKVNVDDNPQIAEAFQVRGIPALFSIREGKVVGNMVGFKGRQAVEGLFKQALV